MEKLSFLLVLCSQLIFSQITDQSGDTAVDANGNQLSGNIRIGFNSSSTTFLRVNGPVTSGGDVGFMVNGNELLVGPLFGDDYNTLITAFGDDISAGSVINLREESILFRTNNQDAIFINDSQYIGIGTNNPHSLLSLGGVGENGTLSVQGDNGGGHIANFRDNDGHNLFQMNGTVDDDTYEIFFGDIDEVSSINNMFVLKSDKSYFLNGNVGIGTSTPDEKLSVNGTIHAKEVRVDLTGWPDYVFDKDYKLPTLKNVEEFIKVNGHLENISNAEEIEVNGIQLGEMNKQLLQKIEELMLYTIEQQKMIDILKKEVELLKN